MFLAGFIIAIFLLIVCLPWLISRLFLTSEKLRPLGRVSEKTDTFKNQSVLSFGFIIPIMIMALVFSIIVGSRITKELVKQGHGEFIFFALVFPVFSFLIGYLYLKKQVLR